MDRDEKGNFVKGHSLGSRFKKGSTPWNKGVSGYKVPHKDGYVAVRGSKHPLYKKIERNCEFCDKLFKTWPCMLKRGVGRYCSIKCRAQDNKTFGADHPKWIEDRSQLKKSEKKHLDSQYRDWSMAVKNRDGWKCKIDNKDCGGRLEAHHILSWRDYKDLRYKVNNGITLCLVHHPRKWSEEKRLIPEFQELVSVSSGLI